MAAIEYIPRGEQDDDRYKWIAIAAPIVFAAFMIALLIWAITTPDSKNPHADQVCVRDTEHLVPMITTDMWGTTHTTMQIQTQCLEWQKVQHQ